jgi:hypothetical protein
MDQINETGHDEMLNCPKCGFQQPRDQYCAKCGVDMVKAAQARPKVSPLAMAGGALLVAGLGFFAYSKFSAQSNGESGTARLASTEKRQAQNPTPSNSQTASSESESYGALNQIAEYDSPSSAQPDEAPLQVHQASTSAAMELASGSKSPSQHALKGKASLELQKQLEQTANSATSKEDGVLVAFAWAEMSKELLQSLQASEPGFHQVPGLEARLRQASGSYRILDVERRRMKDDSEAVTLSKGELSLYFEPMKVGAKEFAGGYTAQFRNSQGELRSPASATASIAPGSGAIVTMGPSPTNPASGVVVLILPRWQD